MSTIAGKPANLPIATNSGATRPLRLKTWNEARAYFAAHLTPISTNRAGWPVYKSEDIKRLNVLLPDEE